MRAFASLQVRRGRTLAVACAVCVALFRAGGPAAAKLLAQDQAPKQVPSFRAGVDLVSVPVTVTDAEGRYVAGLSADDFAVYEDGVKQDVTFFDHSNTPLALALLLDTSASMEDKLGTAQRAAIGFAKRLRPQDVAELVDFDTRVQVLQAFTNDSALLERAILRTTAEGSTSLYNAVYIALQDMKKVRPRSTEEIRRRALVLLSDGEDTSSLLSFDEVLDLARRSETAIYAISTESPTEAHDRGAIRRSLGLGDKKEFNEADYVLREFTQQTGGRVFYPKSFSDLPGIYAQIAEELATQYLLGYVSKNPKRDGAWRRLVVRVGRADTTPRTKQGYFAPTR